MCDLINLKKNHKKVKLNCNYKFYFREKIVIFSIWFIEADKENAFKAKLNKQSNNIL